MNYAIREDLTLMTIIIIITVISVMCFGESFILLN
jgi:hypothetical protein